MTFERFKSHDKRAGQGDDYLATRSLATAVNTALAAGQPLLVTGEPGTGKTKLAGAIARQLGWKLYRGHVRSDHQMKDLLYRFDYVKRFYDSQLKDGPGVDNLTTYRKFQWLGAAISSGEPAVVLIDEIDKAPRDLPNDLLEVIENRWFLVDEMEQEIHAKNEILVVITSNNERRLPDPFLRRCVYHPIKFPDRELLTKILKVAFGDRLLDGLAKLAIDRFEALRAKELLKKPATGELLAWVRVLLQAGVKELSTELQELPHLGALLKTEEDLARIEAERAAPTASRDA